MAATGRDVSVDRLLSEFALDYRPEGFIADALFPVVPVEKQAGLYTVFDRRSNTTRQRTLRAPGTQAAQVTWDAGSGQYFCNNFALSNPVTLEDRANADPIFVARRYDRGAEFIMDHLLLDWDARVTSMVCSGSNVGSYSAVSSAWNGAGNPLANLNQAIDNVHYSNGMHPTDVVFGPAAWKSFRRDSTVRNLIFGVNNGGGYPNEAQVAQLLSVKRVHVSGAFMNQNQEGLSESLGAIWGDNVLVYYRPDSPSIERPSFAYSIRWDRPGLPNMLAERHPYDTRTKSELIEIGYYQDERITGASYGFLLVAVNSST